MSVFLALLPRLLMFLIAPLLGGTAATNVVGMASGDNVVDGWNLGLTLTSLLGTLGTFFTGWKLAPITRSGVLKAFDTLNSFVDAFLKVGKPDDGWKEMILQGIYQLLQKLHAGDKVQLAHVSAMATRNVMTRLGEPAESPEFPDAEEPGPAQAKTGK
ncbi:hypothetical protein Pan44_26900 [Caulifigura coniformis]|uniref:Uncharacterized protein n=1 Tax=Caulifigura coniformis TaxID=2527983 RepID=A0A517SEU8_9PLAN|nr:hypothetical protein [Caulifigura coniformis]QDT54655.1 hypothetical protein Pan44_26900 [Caulifigura coniformis]